MLDGTKFIAAAVPYQGKDPWDMLTNWARVPANPLPLGCVLTLPATGSEMNGGAVISREATQEKLFFVTPQTFPRFSILDPETTYTLAAAADGQRHRRRVRSHDRAVPDLSGRRPAPGPPGRGDPVDADRRRPEGAGRSAELRGAGEPDVVRHQALNGLIGCGVPQDWATHMIGHELTALYGIDQPNRWRWCCPACCGTRSSASGPSCSNMPSACGDSRDGDEDARIDQAIEKTEQFFRSLGVGTRLADYNIPHEAIELVATRLAKRRMRLGEHQDLGEKEVKEILKLRA